MTEPTPTTAAAIEHCTGCFSRLGQPCDLGCGTNPVIDAAYEAGIHAMTTQYTSGLPSKVRTIVEAAAPVLLAGIANDDELLEVARKAIEDVLIGFRDSGIGMVRNNGLVCKYRDGSNSDIIRLGPEDGMQIGLKAIAEHLARGSGPADSEGGAA